MKHNKYLRFFNPMILIIAGALAAIVILIFHNKTDRVVKADQDGHSHFRFGHITWESKEEDPANTARITFIAGFRRSGFSCRNPLTGGIISCTGPNGLLGVGDVILETIGGTQINNFGDGKSTPVLYFKVFSINQADNWLMARALDPETPSQEYIDHTYDLQLGTGPFIVYSASCCRILSVAPPNAHMNNANKNYRVEAEVNFGPTSKASPISLLPPIVDCPRDSLCQFTVAAVDPDHSFPEEASFRWREATPAEMGGSNLVAMPPGATIDPETGLYTWDTRGVPLGPNGYNTLYSTQVIIEDNFNKVASDLTV